MTQIPLRIALIVPFVLLTAGSSGLIGYLSWHNGQRSVNILTNELMVAVSDRVHDYIDDYLATPTLINRLNAKAISLGQITITEPTYLKQHFLQQAQEFPFVKIHFSNPQGGLVGAGNDEKGFVTSSTDRFTKGALSIYEVDPQGNPIKVVLTQPNYDSRQRPFYQKAVEVGKPTWTPIFPYIPASRGLGIAASYPLYDQTKKLQGVLSVDLPLTTITEFLRTSKISQHGQVFIIERSGLMVASSTNQPPFLKSADGSRNFRLRAIESQEPRIRLAAEHLYAHFQDLSQIKTAQQLHFYWQGKKQFLLVTPYNDSLGLDWLVVTVMPKADFMAEIDFHTHTTILLNCLALAGAISLGMWLTRSIVHSIQQISKSSSALAAGKWNQAIQHHNSITELQVLTDSFNCMAEQLQQSLDQVKNALQESEAKYTKVFRTCPDPIGIVSLDGRYLEVNDAFIDLFGYSREEVIGQIAVEVGHWVRSADRQRYVQAVQANESVRNLELAFRTKAGNLLTVLFAAESLELQGQPCIVGIAKDISDRKLAEIALDQEVFRRKALLDSSVDGIVILDQSGNILEANASFANMLGYTLEEITTLNLIDFDALIDFNTHLAAEEIEQKIVGSDFCTSTFETRHRRKDGSIYDVEISANQVEWDEQIVQLCICRDITDRKLAEKALRLSETKFASTFRSSPDPMVITRLQDGCILEVNHSFTQIFGYSLQEAVGQTTVELNLWSHPTDRAHMLQILQTAGTIRDQEYSYRKRSGEMIKGLISAEIIQIGEECCILAILKDITERKQMEEVLRESEQRFRLIAETIDQFFFVKSAESGQYLYLSPAYEKIWGYSCDSLYQDPTSWLETIYPDDRELVMNSFADQFQGNIVRREYRIIRSDGAIRWIVAQVFPIYDEAGNLSQYVGLAEDITTRKQSEEILNSQAEQERLVGTITQQIRRSLDLEKILATTVVQIQQTLQAERVLIFRLNQDGSGQVIQEAVVPEYISLNQLCWVDECFPDAQYEYYRQGTPRIVLDVEMDERGSCLIEFMQKIGVKSKVIAPIVYALEDGTAEVWGLLIVHACHYNRPWQELEAEFLQQISNQLAIAIYQANLYQKLQTELFERRQTEAALRNSETRFRTMFAEAPVGMALLNLEGKIAQVNQVFCQLLNYSESELQVKAIWDITHPQDIEQEQDMFHQLFEREISNYKVEKRLLKRNGETVWVNLTAGLLQDPNSGDFYKLGMYENITEQRLLQQMKDNFVSVVSHELRTPLTSIRGALKLLAIEELENLTPEGQELLMIAITDSQRLVRLVSDILDLERIKSGHLSLVKKYWKATDLITQSLDSVRSLAEAAKIHLQVSAAPDIIYVDGDLIIQTITNLLSNAIKFSFPNTTVSITTTLVNQANLTLQTSLPCLLFRIQDQGRGIPSDKLEIIFEPFEQVDVGDSRQKGGSGLGLAICQSIIQQHKGQFWVTSTLGQGSCFFFTLPLDHT